MNRTVARRPLAPGHATRPNSLAPWCAALALALAGCTATMPTQPDAAARVTSATPAATGTPFAAALRCMDTLLLEHGVRDVSVLVEDLADKTARPVAGGKDLLQGIVAEMTPRSRAIRLVASGADWGQTLNTIAQAGQRNAAALAPQYALRGAIRTLDASGGATTIAIDLQLLNTQDLSLVPGTASHHTMALRAGWMRGAPPVPCPPSGRRSRAGRARVDAAAFRPRRVRRRPPIVSSEGTIGLLSPQPR
jgi:hypothetical protein